MTTNTDTNSTPADDTTAAPTPRTYETCDVWVCVDCAMWFANGEANPEHDEQQHEDWLADVEHHTGGHYVSLGFGREGHDDDCPNWDGDTWLGASDCWCEHIDFTWSACDTCGSPLGGDRHGATLWLDN